MLWVCEIARRTRWLLLLAGAALIVPAAYAVSCTTQSQMAPAQRDMLANTARTILSYVQRGDAQDIRAMTLPAAAADFSGINASVARLEPLVQSASITVENLYLLDNDGNAQGAQRTDFYCGSPVVVLSLDGLPQGNYALVLVHASGVPHPEQLALIFAQAADQRWMLAGLLNKPMTEAGHDGLWYWTTARKYAQTKWDWDSWFYYRIAADLLNPLDSLSSPNLEKLRHEADQVRPTDLPGTAAMTFYAQGMLFTVTGIDTSTALGGLDLDVHYTPDAAQTAALHDPQLSRTQVTALMTRLLEMHPELRGAFHGIWVHADQHSDQGTNSLFALELPMEQITAQNPPAAGTGAVSR
jgi:hypothetical protein